jgi:hypothetical protein
MKKNRLCVLCISAVNKSFGGLAKDKIDRKFFLLGAEIK